MKYSSHEDYKAKMKNSGTFRKENDYEVFSWNICLECKYFKADPQYRFHGECILMEQEEAYNGVMATAVCNRYVNTRGFDLNHKVVEPSLLPAWIRTRKDKKTGETYLSSIYA